MHVSLSNRSEFSVVAAVAGLDEALTVTRQTHPHIVIIDMATPGSLEGARRIHEVAPDVHIIGFGVEEVESEILACAEAGFAGYVPCHASLDDLVASIDSVARGELLCTPKMAGMLFRRLKRRNDHHPPPERLLDLTTREREVLRLIDLGLSNKEIAVRLRIEISTVKNHVHNVLEKLHVTSRLQAARLASHGSTRSRGLAAGDLSPRD
jgi:DNA-binding NarL/FixJ family response regulator